MNREEKDQMIATIDGMLNDNNNFYLADISGLTAEQNSALRRLCFKREGGFPFFRQKDIERIFQYLSKPKKNFFR